MSEEPPGRADGAPSPADAEEAMHFHRPRPLHGLREILTEIGVVVIGIAIALGGEQVIEAFHWKGQVDASEAALKIAYVREVRNATVREAQDDCVTRRLAALSSIVRQASESGRLPPVGAFGHPSYRPWTIGAWDAVVASQTVSHLPREKMITYVGIAQMTAFLSGLGDREEDEWTTLDSMVGPGRRLSDVEAEQLRTNLAKAAASNREFQTLIVRLLDQVKVAGLVDPSDFDAAARNAASGKAKAAICQPTATPVAG
jgi:hypothetical protein